MVQEERPGKGYKGKWYCEDEECIRSYKIIYDII